MARAVEASLRRLKTDYIDLYWLHFWDGLTPVEEVMDTLDSLVRDGKVRYVGLSDTPAWYLARAETLASKPAFRDAYQHKRCLIVADGFYESQKSPDGKSKTPMYITVDSGAPFAFAGLWDTWKQPDGERLRTCTFITTEPNDLMAPIHNRMPVILPPNAYDLWLDPDTTEPEVLNGLLVPYPSEHMSAHPVSETVNSPKNDTSECIIPVPPETYAKPEQLSLL